VRGRLGRARTDGYELFHFVHQLTGSGLCARSSICSSLIQARLCWYSPGRSAGRKMGFSHVRSTLRFITARRALKGLAHLFLGYGLYFVTYCFCDRHMCVRESPDGAPDRTMAYGIYSQCTEHWLISSSCCSRTPRVCYL
jgi:hypothetical protein